MERFGRFISVLVIAFLPLYYIKFNIFDIPTNVIELLILSAFTAAMFAETSKNKSISPMIVFGVVLLIVGVGVGTLVASDTRIALGILKGWFIIPAAFGFSIWKLFDNKNINQVFQAILFTVMTVSVYALLQWGGYIPLIAHQTVGGNLAQYLAQSRAIAFFESPNFLAMYLVPLAALAGAYVWAKTRSIALMLITIMPAVAAVYLSGSRAGLVAMAAVVVISLLWQKSIRSALIVSAVLLAAVSVYSLSTPKENTGDSARLFIWRHATQIVIEDPLAGIGPGQFQQELDRRLPDDQYYQYDVRPYALHPHNLFLTTWLSAGILGLLGLVIIILSMTVSAAIETHISRYRVGIIAALAAVVMHGFFDTTFYKNDLAIIFFLIIALWQVCESTGRRYDAS